MRPFLFVFEVKPTPANKQAEGVAGAMAHIWVFSTSMDRARDSARRHLAAYKWLPVKEQHALEPTAEQVAALDTIEAANYRKAECNGIAAQFHGWPEKPRPGVYEYRPLSLSQDE